MSEEHRNMGHDEARGMLPSLLSGTLDEGIREAVEEHLEVCAACREEAAGLRALWEDLPDRAPARPPADLWPEVRSRLLRERVLTLPERQPWGRLAASFAAGLLMGLLLWRLGTGGPAPSQASVEELMAHGSLFEQMDPVPPQSAAGRYLALMSFSEDEGGVR
ncbi:MAG: zf-HC2 domain-containing protein [bacterium]